MNNEILILENQQVIMNTLACFIGYKNDSYDDLKKQFEKTKIIVHPENKPT